MDFSSFIAGSDFSDGDDLYQPKYFLISSPKTSSLQDFVTAWVCGCARVRLCVCVRVCVCVCVFRKTMFYLQVKYEILEIQREYENLF